MELYAKGQLSYLILNCLLERDFYGLDIITEINSKSGGRVNLKKPSVYSNLNRMEKQGYVSSYMRSSELGPNRKYYSITDSGREFYNEIENYFSRNKIDVFSQFEDDVIFEQQKISTSPSIQEEPSEDDEFFDFSGVEETDSNEPDSQIEENVKALENTVEERETKRDDYAFSIKNALLSAENTKEEVKEEPQVKDDGLFLSKQEVADYNQRLYDISKDIKSYKKKKSFAEDQIAITSEAPLLSSSIEKRRANLENFKNSLMQNKTNYAQSQNDYSMFANYKEKNQPMQEEVQPTQEEKKDDAKLITGRIDSSEVEKPRKIQPPRLNILPDSNKNKLPPPKRDASIDPSHQEILSRLYSKTKGASSQQQREDCLYDYSDLKDFYKNQNIAFDVYEKPTEKIKHNTNKLYFITSVATLLLATVGSVITYLILSSTSMLNKTFNFLYILLPALLIIDLSIHTYNMIKYKSWLPKQILPQWQIWTLACALIFICIGLNFAFGLAIKEFSLFATTLILPIVMILIEIPFKYYLKRYLLIKKWK